MLASIAAEMQSVAVGWELYQRTNSAAALGYVGLVQFLPVALLLLPAGHAADRYSRKAMLAFGQCMMACASLALAVLSFSQGPVPLIYACLLLVGIGQACNMPARWALVAQIVPDAALANAVTWNSSGWQIASVIGPALGGVVIAGSGQAIGAYLLAAICSLTCAMLVVGIRTYPTVTQREPLSLRSLIAGIGFVRRTPAILATITLDLFAVLFGGAVALLPIFARDILEVGPVGLGWLRAAPSVGALLMAMVMAHRPRLLPAGQAMLGAVAGFGVTMTLFGLSTSFAFSLVMLALAGALDNISVVVRGTLVQVMTPDGLRGRVSAVNGLFISSSNQLGAFESGITADWFGPVWSVAGGGIATVLVVLAVTAMWPRMLSLGYLHEIRAEEGPDARSSGG